MRLFVFLLTFLAIAGLSAQSVSGIVKGESAKGKEVLIGASVYFINAPAGVFTDENGRFTLDKPSDADSLVFSFIGYLNDTLEVSAGDEISILLEENVNMMLEAEVEGETQSTKLSLLDPQNAQIITENELQKAACCNLSESFETNASIDASFTDAVTGTAQIRMLGLDGKYTQIMQDVVPYVRGLYVVSGLSFIPGPWIQSIQISKGMGSVSNGYESMTGQINVTMKNPENAEKLYLNAYGNQGGRTELNISYLIPVSKRFSTLISAHGELNETRLDMNNDGFLDNPLKRDVVLRNSWKYMSLNQGWRGEYALTFVDQNRLSGQLDYNSIGEVLSGDQWGAEFDTRMISAYAKTGYLFQNNTNRSFGSQLTYTNYSGSGNYGLREYDGEQESARVNLLFSTALGSPDHMLMTGASFQYDSFKEDLDSLQFRRVERVPGAFAEYTFNYQDRLTLVAGMRGDYHNLFGWFWSPRLHMRYSLTDNTSIKLAGGKGYRTSNVLMEHVGVLASNRRVMVNGLVSGAMPNLDPEISWNSGINLLSKFRLFYRDASISLDYYYTFFEDQVVMDLENPREASFYNLEGESFSHSAQVEFGWTPARRWDLRLAYRWLDVRTQFNPGLLSKPFINEHRGFVNIAYETKENDKKGKWKFDLTANAVGPGRLPSTMANPEEFQLDETSDSFVLLNAQVTKVFSEQFDIYLGGENLGNFRQPRPIVAADQPFSEFFDASMVWGPVFGRMVYAGLRWKIE